MAVAVRCYYASPFPPLGVYVRTVQSALCWDAFSLELHTMSKKRMKYCITTTLERLSCTVVATNKQNLKIMRDFFSEFFVLTFCKKNLRGARSTVRSRRV